MRWRIRCRMSSEWQKYENEVYEECCRIYGEEKVEKNVTRAGVSSRVARQIDVLVHTDEGDMAFDAKYYSKHVDVKTVESTIGMYGDLGVEKFVIITNKGYSKAALRRAHLGKDNVEADVLSLGELKRMQGYWAMPYAGRNCIMLVPPFGWIIDGKKSAHPGMSTVLYRRGVDFEETILKDKEFAYVKFWDKDDEIHTIPDLMEHHRQECVEADEGGEWEILEEMPYAIAKFKHTKAVVDEYFGYREFENFILFVVLLCGEEKWGRNRNKLRYMLEHAIPGHVRRVKNN